MTPIAIWLAALGIADLVAAPGGTRSSIPRGIAASVVAGVITAVAIVGSGYEITVPVIVALSVGSLILVACWIFGRHYLSDCESAEGNTTVGCPSIRVGPTTLLAGVGMATLAVAATAGLWPESDGGAILNWVEGLPYAAVAKSPERAAFAGAVLISLVGTANAIVRLALRAAEVNLDETEGPDTQLKGGRLIGPIERLLIFALAIAGEPTAAALIISAKGLLRFPELTSASREPNGTTVQSGARPVDVLTEYLLVGSLVSWSLALLPVCLLP